MTETVTNNGRVLVRRGAAIWILLLVCAAWILMGAGDWTLRFLWFRWQDTWLIRPSSDRAEAIGFAHAVTNAAHKGGDLTRLIGISSVAAPYERERPAAVIWFDEYGYRNRPPVSGRSFPIVVVGDSYMEDGVTMEDTIPGQLAAVSGLDVYNHGLAGWGSFLSVARFFRSPRFRSHPPTFLLFGIIEREVQGSYFEGLTYQLYVMQHSERADTMAPGLDFRTFSPGKLKASLPDTSALAQIASRWWNRVRYEVMGQMAPYVVPAEGAGRDANVLFYYPSIDAMGWPPARRDVEKVADAVKYMDNICVERGITLVVLLIPDKEQVYRDWLPARFNDPENPLPPSCLWPLEKALDERYITTVNLLPVFREAAARGEQLYWPDDTHWNPEGIRLAVQTTWAEMQKHLDPSQPVLPRQTN